MVLALEQIPAGRTCSFGQLAARAGQAGAARAVGRLISALARADRHPWHRVVRAGGELARDPGRAVIQRQRLQAEGARPRPAETVRAWARRRGSPWVGNLSRRIYLPADDPAVDRWPADRVEALDSVDQARARGLRAVGSPPRSLPGLPQDPEQSPSTAPVEIAALAWAEIEAQLQQQAFVWLPGILDPGHCGRILAAGSSPAAFARSVDMRRHGFGEGIYRYWQEPLPVPLAALRQRLYSGLLPLARAQAGAGARAFAPSLAAFHQHCAAGGQHRASSILISHEAGGINHLHRDRPGPIWFPFQCLLMLRRRGRDFSGGELIIQLEPRGAPPRIHRLAVDVGDLVIFAAARLPRAGSAVPVRHGMSRVEGGRRDAVGLVFHLAR